MGETSSLPQIVEKVYERNETTSTYNKNRRRRSFCEETTKSTHIGFASVAKRPKGAMSAQDASEQR